MGKRIRLGLIFPEDKNWIGGTYYILNLISALATLPEEKQPFIIILSTNENDFLAAKKTGYLHLAYQNPFDYKRNIPEAVLNKLLKIITKRDCIDKRISKRKIDVLFPASNNPCFDRVRNKVYWFPDFQHIFYPHLFSAEELSARNSIIKEIANGTHPLVLSSQAAKHDLESLKLPGHCPTHVIPFAVTHPSLNDIEIADVLDEFQIEKEYFIISNQFWKHKNHLVVLKAAMELNKKGVTHQFIFTGKEDDYRNPGYFQSILAFIEEHHLEVTIKLLGLIDRKKQLKLMQYAKAVIQPSLFEGWSTVIEDAKSLGKLVIASDIPVHKEQLPAGGLFFDPHSENELVAVIMLLSDKENHPSRLDYNNSISTFGESFIKIISGFKYNQ
jgi:glycosyltransferase involved in cell wall biosynthesis